MSKISGFLVELRRSKVLGACSDPFTFDLMWQGDNAVLLRYIGTKRPINQWVLVERSSKQYFKVKVLRSQFDFSYTMCSHYRNSRLTTEYIKSLI